MDDLVRSWRERVIQTSKDSHLMMAVFFYFKGDTHAKMVSIH